MPDMPQGGPPPAPGGAPQSPPPGGGQPPQAGGGGGIAQAIISVDQTLNKITQAVAGNQQVPPEVKSDFQDALTSFRKASQGLVKAAGGGGGGQGEPDGDEGGAVTPQQGGAQGAVPVSHQNMRGG